MKMIFIISLLVSFTAFAEVTLLDCQSDAVMHVHHKTPVQPLPECVDLVKADPSHQSVTSSNGRWKAFGIGNMIYVETYEEGSMTDRSLLAGEFSELVSIQKIFIDSTYKRLFIVQVKNEVTELMIQNIEFIGNVSPLKVMRSSAFSGLTTIKFNSPEQIEFTNASGTFIVNADGESRTWLSTKKDLQISPK